jgi:uncharacterized protein YndB with AHSA1/START domain
MAARNKSNEIRITRLYDAPVKAVWDAWTDPQQVAQWWGPRGFTITHHSRDFKPGGTWHYTMHGPDGVDYPNKTLYHEIVPYSRMVYDHGGYDDRPPLFRVTVQFTEVDGKTTLDMWMSFATPEVAKEMGAFIKKAGGNGTWDRLGEYLAKQSTGIEKFIINRSFAVPVEQLYEMWTNPEHLCQWLPPTGFTMKMINGDIRTGGGAFFSMSNGQGITFHCKTKYLSVQKPNTVVYTQQFCDADGKICRHPLAPVWPESMLTSVLLTPEDDQLTRVTVCSEPFDGATPAEIQAFSDARTGMTGGWTGSFDKLEELTTK